MYVLTGAAELSGGLNTLTANSEPLNSGARQVFETLLATTDTQLAAAVEQQRLSIQEQMAAQVIAAAVQMDRASYDAAVAAGLIDQAVQAAVGAGELKAGTDQLQAAVPTLIDGIIQLQDGVAQLSDGLQEFNEEGIQNQ